MVKRWRVVRGLALDRQPELVEKASGNEQQGSFAGDGVRFAVSFRSLLMQLVWTCRGE